MEMRRFDRWLKIEEGCKYAKDPKVAGIPAPLPNCTHPRNREGVCKYYWCPLVSTAGVVQAVSDSKRGGLAERRRSE
jgi:hypothetical protein